MKIQFTSDLHMEMRQYFELEKTDSDVIVLAGDIHVGSKGVDFAGQVSIDHDKPVIYVAGNHEFYHYDFDEVMAAIREKAEKYPNLYFLENDGVTIGDTRFLGATLWTDFIGNGSIPQQRNMGYISMHLNDHRVIRRDGGRFMPQHALNIHHESRAWLEAQLNMPFDGHTVVVTHHGPSLKCQHKNYPKIDSMATGFLSHIDNLVEKADLWIYGHSHSNLDDKVGRCRLVSNQTGYPHEDGFVPGGFRPKWVIGLGEDGHED